MRKYPNQQKQDLGKQKLKNQNRQKPGTRRKRSPENWRGHRVGKNRMRQKPEKQHPNRKPLTQKKRDWRWTQSHRNTAIRQKRHGIGTMPFFSGTDGRPALRLFP